MPQKGTKEMLPNTARSQTNIGRWVRLVLVLLLPCGIAVAEPLPKDLAERKLARLLEMISESSEPTDNFVSTHLLMSDWPGSLLPTVVTALTMVLEQRTADLDSTAVRVFAERNREDAALLVPSIAALLPKSDYMDAVELLRAVRAIGPRANSLEGLVRSKLRDSDAVVVIHSASALTRIAPTSKDDHAILMRYLVSERPEHRWRASDAIARSAVWDERWVAELRELLVDDDVRVRVTSAYALWRITDDASVSLPVLLASLSEDDISLATAYVFPSYQGESHRVYALQAIMDMDPAGKRVVPEIVSVIRDVASAETPASYPHAKVGLVALQAIHELGSVTEAEFKDIESAICRDACAFVLVRDRAQKALASITRRDK